MEKLIYANGQYKIRQLAGGECLQELAEFIVRGNYKHHVGKHSYKCIRDEINSAHQKERQYIDRFMIFVVRNNVGKILGLIRFFKWDSKKILPIQKTLGINLLKNTHTESDYSYRHIGRFAINSFTGIPTITLFKQLMVYAVHPIVCDTKSYMIAETDSKLLKVMNDLDIETIQTGQPVKYLASETTPVYACKKGLLRFYKRYATLYKTS